MVNGKAHPTEPGTTVSQLLLDLQLALPLVVLEYNGDILHRQDWPTTKLQDQDRLEVVTVVGGG
jgi:sulfur carrier protein